MAVNLTKGQKVDLTKGNHGLTNVTVGLGWDTNKYEGGDFDLDTHAFLLGANGKVTSNDDFIYFNNKTHNSGSVEHTGDNLTGAGDGDDEQINVHLDKVPVNIDKIAFTIAIYQASQRNQNFGMVDNAYVRVFNTDNNEELIRYDLTEDFSIETAIVAGEIYRHNGEWKFSAVGSGFAGELQALCENFGVN